MGTYILTVHSFVLIRFIAGLIVSGCTITFETRDNILSGHDKVCMNIRGIIRILIKSFPEASIFSSLKPYLDIFPYKLSSYALTNSVFLHKISFILLLCFALSSSLLAPGRIFMFCQSL